MKIRRTLLEVETPWEINQDAMLECLRQGFDEIGYGRDGTPTPYQAQVVSFEESPNTQIGEVVERPPQ